MQKLFLAILAVVGLTFHAVASDGYTVGSSVSDFSLKSTKEKTVSLADYKDAKGFMDWARHNQIITDVWYSANPTLSVKNIYQNNFYIFLGNFFQCLMQGRMFEPTGSNAAITHFIAGQLLQHFHFCTGMAQHVYKIIDNDVDIIVQEVMNVIYQIQSCLVVHYFGI